MTYVSHIHTLTDVAGHFDVASLGQNSLEWIHVLLDVLRVDLVALRLGSVVDHVRLVRGRHGNRTTITTHAIVNHAGRRLKRSRTRHVQPAVNVHGY